MLLGVNIDHIAVLREARMVNDPDLLDSLSIVKRAGGDQITIHLREDRRHIQDDDLKSVIKYSSLPVNMECSINDEMIEIATTLKPHRVTLVPENRKEVTTEGGLDVKSNFQKIKNVINRANEANIETSLFIDPNEELVELSKELNANWIELHTGHFCNIYAMAFTNLKHTNHCIKELDLPRNTLNQMYKKSLQDIILSAKIADEIGLNVAAGHGLNYQNITQIAKIPYIKELNIGQSIIARSIFVGLEKAIIQMRECL